MGHIGFMSPWKELIKPRNLSLLGLRETLEGGQTFSWDRTSDCSWIGSFSSKLVELKFADDFLYWRTSLEHSITESEIKEYFWLDSSYDDAIDDLPWRSDPILNSSIKKLMGLTILRQPLDETLFYFILSSAKSIVQIKEIGHSVCKKWGQSLGYNHWSFPGWNRIAEISENELRSLKLGYRAKYVSETAKLIRARKGWLRSILKLDYAHAKIELKSLPGVGDKVADCVLLFGGNFQQAFPIDTWIEKSLEKRYDLKGWNTKQKVHFAHVHFGKFAGLAQQFLFSAERLNIFN